MPERRTVLEGRYKLIRQIGEGGFSRAYLADDLRLGRRVIAKILRTELTRDQASLRRFEREAKIAAQVSGPNLVDVYDYGTDDEHPVIISQWIDGVDLSRVVRKHSGLRSDDAISITLDILGGLETLHAAGIQHRDVKPSNVLIPKWNAPAKLTDFGISRAADDPRLTMTGEVLGSPVYMSPEQVEGMELTPSTDLYSVSVVLFELVTGSPPFTGESASKIMLQHVASAPPPPRLLKPDVEPALEQIILKGLAKPPEERFASAAAMAKELRKVLETIHSKRGITESAYRTRVIPPEDEITRAAHGPAGQQEAGTSQPTVHLPGVAGRKRGLERPRKRIPIRKSAPAEPAERRPSTVQPKRRRSWFPFRRRRIPRYPVVLALLVFFTVMLFAIIQSLTALIEAGGW